jgi:allantoin racemase
MKTIEGKEIEELVLGRTAEFRFFRELEGYLGMPVIDAAITPFKYAESLVDLKRTYGWGYSGVGGYEPAPEGEIKEWKLW